MVKLGFIVEGETERIVLEKSDFFNYLQSLNIAYIPEVIDAKGNGNLLPDNIIPHTKTLEDKGATQIFILTDLDNDQCITYTKERISPLSQHIVTVSIKAIEAWFLADTMAMCNFLKDTAFTYEMPEDVTDPFEEVKAIRLAKNNRGIGSKPILAQLMIRNSFSIQRAALHPNCNSAKYFLEMIRRLSPEGV
jgi:hypothetical protein